MWRVVWLLILIATAACQTTAQAPPNNPEVVVKSPPEIAKPVVITDLLGRGYQITRDSDYLLVLDRRSDNLLVNVLIGSELNPVVNARLSITFLPIGDSGTRIVVNMAVVRNPGTAFEALTPVTAGPAVDEIQAWLATLPARLG